MKRLIARASVVVLGLASLLLGIVVSQAQMTVGSGDVIADRQRLMITGRPSALASALMKLNGASAKDLNDKLKAGNIEAMVVNAETIAINAQHIPSLFPKGSVSDKSNAKPDIWEKWSDFEGAAKTLQTKAEELRDAARAKDQPKVEALMKDFGRTTCGACHTPFRKPLN